MILSTFVRSRDWTHGEGPTVLLGHATVWLRRERVLLPGVTTLTKLVQSLREEAQVGLDEKVKGAVRMLGVDAVDLSVVPPARVRSLARYGNGTTATLVATMSALVAAAVTTVSELVPDESGAGRVAREQMTHRYRTVAPFLRLPDAREGRPSSDGTVMEKCPTRSLIAAAATLGLLGFAAPASASDESQIESTADLIARVAPDQGPVAALPVVAGAISLASERGTATVSLDPDEPILIESAATPNAPLEASLPPEVAVAPAEVASDGTRVYEAVDGGADVAVQVIDEASMRIQTILPDASGPTSFTYDLGLPTDTIAVTNPDGSITFTNTDGEWVAGAAAPWATDATGRGSFRRHGLPCSGGSVPRQGSVQ